MLCFVPFVLCPGFLPIVSNVHFNGWEWWQKTFAVPWGMVAIPGNAFSTKYSEEKSNVLFIFFSPFTSYTKTGISIFIFFFFGGGSGGGGGKRERSVFSCTLSADSPPTFTFKIVHGWALHVLNSGESFQFVAWKNVANRKYLVLLDWVWGNGK